MRLTSLTVASAVLWGKQAQVHSTGSGVRRACGATTLTAVSGGQAGKHVLRDACCFHAGRSHVLRDAATRGHEARRGNVLRRSDHSCGLGCCGTPPGAARCSGGLL